MHAGKMQGEFQSAASWWLETLQERLAVHVPASAGCIVALGVDAIAAAVLIGQLLGDHEAAIGQPRDRRKVPGIGRVDVDLGLAAHRDPLAS